MEVSLRALWDEVGDSWGRKFIDGDGDVDPRMVLADWYGENGDGSMEYALRWAVWNYRRPCPLADRYYWYDGGSWEGDTEDDLPGVVFAGLPGGPVSCAFYDSEREAYEALAVALKLLGDGKKSSAAGVVPEEYDFRTYG